MPQSTSSSNSGAHSGTAKQLQTPAQRNSGIFKACAQCVKSGAECLLCAGKSVACAHCQSRKEKCEFAELRRMGHIPSSAKGKARATTRSPSPGINPSSNSGSATPVPAVTPTPASPTKSRKKKERRVWVPRHGHRCTPDCACYFELAQLKQVYRQLQSHYCAVRRDQQRLSEMYTRMEHAVGSLTDWVMTEDSHFTAGLTPRFRHLSPTPGPPMTDFSIDDELRKQSLNPTIDNIFYDFDVPEDQWEDYVSQRVKLEDNLGVGTSRIRSDEAQEEMEVEDGLVTPADEDLEFDGEEWGGIPEEDR
ncbi:hypothetical protein B0H10DRAFT_1956539 [Mycena sp. CBHHK59/15]|nr:hypothetical protein B0H10DRAFT_1956539 [Mycena sp. CBHHK59/15]